MFLLSSLAAAAQNPCDGRGPAYANVPGDTTIILKGGAQAVFNRCEFFDLRECLDIREIYQVEEIDAAGLTTQDTRGRSLATYGMLSISLRPGCTERACFEVPVTLRIPCAMA